MYHADMDEQVSPLPPGTIAPDFTLPQSARVSVSLKNVRGQPIVLVFYPLDWEPVSLQQLALCQDYLVEFERLGACLIAISGDHVFSHAALARDIRLTFPLLSDTRPTGAVARTYGVFRESQGLNARAVFVTDSSGIIRFSQAYPDLLNPGANDILTTLETLAVEAKFLGSEPNDMSGAGSAWEAPTMRRYPNKGSSDEGLRARVHDLKQEMTIARGYAQLLAEYAQRQGELDDERIRGALQRIDASTTHMADLLDETLTVVDPNWL